MLTVSNLQRLHIGPVNLRVQDGEVMAITGPSGAGKSLLLRAIVDLDPNSGDISTNNMNRAKVSAPIWRRHVAMLPAESGWWQDNVGAHFQNPAKINTRLTLVGLPSDALNWQVARLSSGEKHRLALLRCLEHTPEVLLLDEPTAALDPETTTLVETLLQHLLDDGISILIVTHDLAQITRLNASRRHLQDGALT